MVKAIQNLIVFSLNNINILINIQNLHFETILYCSLKPAMISKSRLLMLKLANKIKRKEIGVNLY